MCPSENRGHDCLTSYVRVRQGWIAWRPAQAPRFFRENLTPIGGFAEYGHGISFRA